LRERREDIEPLALHLMGRVGRRHARSVRLSPNAVRALLRYDWPGNVRELENALEYALAVCRGQTVHPHDLPLEVTGSEAFSEAVPVRQIAAPVPSQSDSPTAAAPERERILIALETHQWRRAEAAAALGMSRTTLWRKMRELGLLE
jgi:DNA-binding NtrC family response regulator